MEIDLQPPYWVARDGLPGTDFNREILQPGENELFPDGALAIRADDDFWAVAALPLKYRETPLPEIVQALWPEYADKATYCPDHGTVDQRIYQAEQWAQSLERQNRHLDKELRKANDALKRVRAERPRPQERYETRARAENDYFIRQYEHLAVAVAHPAEPRADPKQKGICERCGLYCSDRIHSKRFIERHAEGYSPSVKHLTEYVD